MSDPIQTAAAAAGVIVNDAAGAVEHVKTEIEKLGDETKHIEVTIIAQAKPHLIWLIAFIALVVGIIVGHHIK